MCSLTFGIAARPSLQRVASSWMRAVTRARPSARGSANASGSAQRCSNDWKPPGVVRGPGGSESGGSPFIQASNAPQSKVGIDAGVPLPRLGAAPDHAGAARAEDPLVAAGDEEVAPEVGHGLLLDAEAVDAVDAEEHAVVRAAALVQVGERVGSCVRMGSFTPVDECTHVTATARVRGPTALTRLPTISSSVALSGVA